jgi:hypothetical protein
MAAQPVATGSDDSASQTHRKISTVGCGKICGQLTIKHTKFLNLLDFDQSAHASGRAASSLRPLACIDETESLISEDHTAHRFLCTSGNSVPFSLRHPSQARLN